MVLYRCIDKEIPEDKNRANNCIKLLDNMKIDTLLRTKIRIYALFLFFKFKNSLYVLKR